MYAKETGKKKLGSSMFNTINRFGLVTIILHWLIALAIFVLFGLGWYFVELTYYDALYNILPSVHKSVGILLAVLFVISVIWRAINRKPDPLRTSSQLEVLAASVAHFLLSLLTGLILISGYLIPTANGASISVFEWFDVPAIIANLPQQEDIAGLIHKYLSYAIIGVVIAAVLRVKSRCARPNLTCPSGSVIVK
jgi:cytochrome b561